MIIETAAQNWDWANSITETEPADGWLICCKIETADLTAAAEQSFLEALREIVFYTFKNHVVTINDFVTGIKQDNFYALLEDFNLSTL